MRNDFLDYRATGITSQIDFTQCSALIRILEGHSRNVSWGRDHAGRPPCALGLHDDIYRHFDLFQGPTQSNAFSSGVFYFISGNDQP
jgi:hypothetical protein